MSELQQEPVSDLKFLTAKVQEDSAFCRLLMAEVGRTVIGQRSMVQGVLTGMLAGGHVLLEGLPGLAKTTAVKAFADAVALHFKRIQFTPDLLPADLLGTNIFNARESRFEIRKGPLFAHLVLADEINRAPSKVQSALLEAMQERTITIGDETFRLEEPFLVLATQNPIEQEGTYPLPEAQIDRFLLKIKVGYPDRADEIRILEAVSGKGLESTQAITSRDQILKARETVRKIYMDQRIQEYIVSLVLATRDPKAIKRPELAPLIRIGASPRASIGLAQAAKAHAFIEGRAFVTPEDVKSVAMEVMRHRMILSYEAEAEEIDAETILQRILDTVEVP